MMEIGALRFDNFVESRKRSFSVIPAPHQVRDKLQPEPSFVKQLKISWTPFFNGVTTFCETVKFEI